MKIKVVKSAEYTYQKAMWKAKIEYKDTLYNIFVEEDDNESQFSVHIPDDEKPWNLGEEVFDDELHEEIYTILSENGATCPSELTEGAEYKLDEDDLQLNGI
jgi:hypothetical protein